MTVLVAYVSVMGSTKEIAQHIASRMAAALGDVDCRAAEGIGSVSGYEAVIVGSAIHNQAWLPAGLHFFTNHAPELNKRPVWAFSVGMADALPKPFRRRAAALQQARLAGALRRLVPLRGHRLFSGVYAASQMPAPLRVLHRLGGGRFGDLRDWNAVDAWADQIAGQLTGADPQPPQGDMPSRSRDEWT